MSRRWEPWRATRSKDWHDYWWNVGWFASKGIAYPPSEDRPIRWWGPIGKLRACLDCRKLNAASISPSPPLEEAEA